MAACLPLLLAAHATPVMWCDMSSVELVCLCRTSIGDGRGQGGGTDRSLNVTERSGATRALDAVKQATGVVWQQMRE